MKLVHLFSIPLLSDDDVGYDNLVNNVICACYMSTYMTVNVEVSITPLLKYLKNTTKIQCEGLKC